MEEYKSEAMSMLSMVDATAIPVVVRLRRMLDSLPPHQLADVFTIVVKATHAEKVAVLNALELEQRYTFKHFFLPRWH